MVIRRRPSETWKHTRWTYRRRTLTHYSQAVVAALPVMVGLLTLSIFASALLLIATEVVIVLLLPHLPSFRRQVDASIERAACMHAAASRAALLCRMDARHQRELEGLEEVAARLRATSTLDCAGADEWLGLDNLLAVFVRLAIAHRDSAVVFLPSGGFELDVQIMDLEAVRARGNDEQRAWAGRRLAILRDRQRTWHRARAEQTVLAAELSTIAELVRWMYEQSALGRCVDAHAEVVDAITTCAKSGPILRELAALDSSAPIDPQLLRLGRRLSADLAAGGPPPPQALAC